MLVGMIALQQNARRSTLQMSRLLFEDTSAHVVPIPEYQPRQQRTNATSSDVTDFLPENLKESNVTRCGASKCFYENKHDHSIGYLVTPFSLPKRKRQDGKKSWHEVHVKAWKYALKLEQEYGTRHLYLEPPHNVTVSPQLYKKLNRNISANGHKPKKKERFRKGSTVLVQKVAIIPKTHIFLGAWPDKRRSFKRELPNFLESVSNKDKFYTNFRTSLRELKYVFRKEPTLAKDFQAFFDQRGTMYHADLERCFEPKNENTTEYENIRQTKYTLKALKWLMHDVEEALGRY